MTLSTKGRKAEQAEETRTLLLAAARELFGERGYAGTCIDDVAERVGVTIGALYHHFRDKRALFHAVYAAVERDLSAEIVAGMRKRLRPGATAWDEVLAGCEAFLDGCLDPAVQRILLVEAPSLLSWDERHDFARHGLGMIRRGLRRAIDQGLIEPQPLEPMAHLIRAGLSEGALLIARASDPILERREVGRAIERLLSGLRR